MKRETDGLTVMLLLAIIYMLLRDRQREVAVQQIQSITDVDPVCPYCSAFESSATGAANIRRSLSAHIRQSHPDEWRRLTLQNRTH